MFSIVGFRIEGSDRVIGRMSLASGYEAELRQRKKLALSFFDAVQRWSVFFPTAGDTMPGLGVDDEYNRAGLICYGCRRPAEPGKLYCDDYLCKDMGKLVRYARKGLREEREADEDFQDGVGQKLLSALQGGYSPRRALSKKARAAILKRDNHECCICSKRANHVDHIAGSSNNPSNLRALCADCNTLRAFTPMVEGGIEIPESVKRFQQDIWNGVVSRVSSEQPLLPLDRPDWKQAYPSIQAMRQRIYRERSSG